MADHDDMDDETPGTSSSRESSRQRDQAAATPAIQLRSGTTLGFNTPRVGGASAFQPQLERLQEIDNERSAIRESPMQAQSAHSFATAQDMPDNYDVAGRQVAHRMLPKHAIEKTTNFHFDEIKTHKISTKTKDGYIQWAAIKDILDVMDLLTICNGIRTKPVTGNDNHHGYTEGYQGIHNERTFYVGPDDIYRYHNDFRRVFPTMHAAFDPSFHHVSQEGFNNKDGIRVFQDMDTHFEGRTTNDAMRHWNNLIHFTPRTSATIKEDCVRLDELFFHYEKVLQEKLPNILKMSIFVSHFQFDPRPLVQHRIATLEFTESTYMQMFHSVSSLNTVTSHVVHQVHSPRTRTRRR